MSPHDAPPPRSRGEGWTPRRFNDAHAKGWCPGALRPMPSGDGLIVRLRISCGETPLKLARDIAEWARDFGNGAIDLSARGNLQLRGVREATLPPLSAALAEAGLIDATPEAEAVRNVVVSPFAGLDPADPCDVRVYALAWEAELSRNRALWALPGKFGASFDAGPFPLGVDADLMFGAVAPDALVVRLDGAAEAALGPFPGDRGVAVATALAIQFLSLRATPAARMRDVVCAHGLAPFAQAAGLQATPAPAAPRTRAWIGAHALGRAAFVGFALPYGRIAASDLAALAGLAEADGGKELRLTPWRGVVAPLPSSAAASRLEEAARALNLILDPSDPRLAVAACPGAPACSSALGDTRDLAQSLAPLLPRGEGVALHISGCAKGCAHPAPAPFTVVAGEHGYNLVKHGRADAAPVARGLAPEALRGLIAESV